MGQAIGGQAIGGQAIMDQTNATSRGLETPADLWNPIEPEYYAEATDPFVRALLGKRILIRLNTIDDNDEVVEVQILAGRVVRANLAEGFVLSSLGKNIGEEIYLPLAPKAFKLIEPDLYALSDGAFISKPDFLVAFDIYPS